MKTRNILKTAGLILISTSIITSCTNNQPNSGSKTDNKEKAEITVNNDKSIYLEAEGNFLPKDPKMDNLLTSENTVLLVIDFQEEMMGVVKNMERDVLINNTQAMIKTAQVFNIPIIESTIGVGIGANKSTLPEFKNLMKEVKNIDRISLNAWQNKEVIEAVEKTGRKKLIITGLWTSGCPTYTALDAMKAGYEVYILTDVMGDATTDAHNRAIERMVQAGAIPFTWEGAGAEILRAYTNPNAMKSDKIEGGFVGIMIEHFYPFAGKY